MHPKNHRSIVIVARPAPRNPFAIAARQRMAGRHTASPSGQRQRAERSLRTELDRMRYATP
jgi:hypothetical protein